MHRSSTNVMPAKAGIHVLPGCDDGKRGYRLLPAYREGTANESEHGSFNTRDRKVVMKLAAL